MPILTLLIESSSFLHVRLANATKTWGATYVDTRLQKPVPTFTNTRTVQRDTGSTVAVLEPGHENEQLSPLAEMANIFFFMKLLTNMNHK